MASETDALTALLRQLEAAHKANMEEIKAEKDREMSELKGMVGRCWSAWESGTVCCPNMRSKRPRLKEQNEPDAHHACD